MKKFLVNWQRIRRQGGDILPAELALFFLWVITGFALGFWVLNYIPMQKSGATTAFIREGILFLLFFPIFLYMLGMRKRMDWIILILLLSLCLSSHFLIVAARDWDVVSDRDESLETCLAYLLHGKFPYLFTTHAHNSAIVLPGHFLLALPFFVIFGGMEWTTLFLQAAFLFLLAFRWIKSQSEPGKENAPDFRFLCCMIAGISPILFFEEFYAGDDSWPAYLFAMTILLLLEKPRPVLIAILLCLATLSRNFFFFLPFLVFPYLYRQWGKKMALRTFLIFAGFCLVLLLPFILWNPRHFFYKSPMGVSLGKFSSEFRSKDSWFFQIYNYIFAARASIRHYQVALIVIVLAWWGGVTARSLSKIILVYLGVISFAIFSIQGAVLLEYYTWFIPPALILPFMPLEKAESKQQTKIIFRIFKFCFLAFLFGLLCIRFITDTKIETAKRRDFLKNQGRRMFCIANSEMWEGCLKQDPLQGKKAIYKGKEGFIEGRFLEPGVVKKIQIKKLGSDIETKGFQADIFLIDLKGKPKHILTIKEENIGYAPEIHKDQIQSLPENYSYNVEEKGDWAGMRIEFKGHGWFTLEDIRAYGD